MRPVRSIQCMPKHEAFTHIAYKRIVDKLNDERVWCCRNLEARKIFHRNRGVATISRYGPETPYKKNFVSNFFY
jgi:hypothetical protein